MKLKTTCYLIIFWIVGCFQPGSAQELVKDVWPGPVSGLEMISPQMTELNNMLFFAASDGVSEREIWKSDGTTAGTVLLRDISGGDANPSNLTLVNDVLYFSAMSDEYDNELWKTDGTEAGTELVKDFNPDGHSLFHSFVAFSDSLFLVQEDNEGSADMILYKTNGTEAGTVPVRDENGDIVKVGYYTDYSGSNILVAENKLFFLGESDVFGTELWVYDGSEARMVKDITPGAESSPIYDLTNVNGTLFFGTYSGLWKSDGTEAGTVQVSETAPFFGTGTNMAGVENTLYFVNGDPGADRELWKSDGTPAGTQLVRNINPTGNSSPQDFTEVNDILYFTAEHPDYGRELWKSDGTVSGTSLVSDIRPGPAGSSLEELTNINGQLYFSATDGVNGVEMWRHTGTSSSMLFEIVSGSTGGNPENFLEIDGTLFFTAYTPETGTELWKFNLPPTAVLVIPEALRDYLRYEVFFYAGERDWSWTDIFVDWKVDPACGENNVPCPEEFFTTSLVNEQEEVIWQESFYKPLQIEIPVADTRPFQLQVSHGKENPREIISINPFLVSLGIKNFSMKVFPQEGYFDLKIDVKDNTQVPMVLALTDAEGNELWTTEFVAPFEGKFDDKTEGQGVQFVLKPAKKMFDQVFDVQMLVNGSDKVIPLSEGDEIDGSALELKFFKIQLGKAPDNVKFALFKIYRNGHLISVKKDFYPKYTSVILGGLKGNYRLAVDLYSFENRRPDRLYSVDLNFRIEKNIRKWPFFEVHELFKIFPNPVINNAVLYMMQEENGFTNISVMTYQGEVVMEKEYKLDAGSQKVELDLAGLRPGLYKCVIKSQGQKEAKVIGFMKRR